MARGATAFGEHGLRQRWPSRQQPRSRRERRQAGRSPVRSGSKAPPTLWVGDPSLVRLAMQAWVVANCVPGALAEPARSGRPRSERPHLCGELRCKLYRGI